MSILVNWEIPPYNLTVKFKSKTAIVFDRNTDGTCVPNSIIMSVYAILNTDPSMLDSQLL